MNNVVAIHLQKRDNARLEEFSETPIFQTNFAKERRRSSLQHENPEFEDARSSRRTDWDRPQIEFRLDLTALNVN